MPTLKRKPVPLVPLPDAVIRGTLPETTDVFYLQATGEVFLDFEAYSNRISFYLQKIFSCEATGKTNIDFYTALNSERRESENMHARLPSVLKSRILQTVQFQIMGRLDSLIDYVYDRYRDRFIADETCIVDVAGDKYTCRVHKVFPPRGIRDVVAAGGDPNLPIDANFDAAEFDFSKYAHSVAFDLSNSDEVVKAYDKAEDYSYTVQLVDAEGRYEGSLTEARSRSLSRDRLAFSKSILKRLLKECLQRDSLISSPWTVKPRIARQYGLPTSEPDSIKNRNKEIRSGALAKRKRKAEDGDIAGHRKRAKEMLMEDGSLVGGFTIDANTGEKIKPRIIKYPIEDLALDPFSIYDGRILRKRGGDNLTLPPYPILRKDFGVPLDLINDNLQVWSTLNVFGWPLILSNFTMDQFHGALHHQTLEPRSTLLAEMHGCLLALLVAENYRLPGTQSATGAGVLPPFAIPAAGSADALISEEDRDKYIRAALVYSRKWDRSKRLNAASAREGWEKHLIGCLCQRGGIETLPQLPRIMKHLFLYQQETASPTTAAPANENDAPLTEPEHAPPAEPETAIETPAPAQTLAPPENTGEDELASDLGEETGEAADEVAFQDGNTPARQYLSLSIDDKLAILRFLCEMVMATRTLRRYIEDCENALTGFRKRRIQINAERKVLNLQKSAMEGNEKARAALAASEQLNPTPAPELAPIEEAPLEEEPKEEVASDVDELASNGDSPVDDVSQDHSFPSVAGSRTTPLRDKSQRKHAQAAARAQEVLSAKEVARRKSLQIQGTSADRKRVDDGLVDLDAQDDWLDREFRRHQQVMRIKPIGRDRFLQQYWFFDGVGTMELLDEQDQPMTHTGRIFVQGPSQEDWQITVEMLSTEDALNERAETDLYPQKLLRPGEWGYLEHSSDVDKLLTFLNVKGNREMAFKVSLKSLRPYIVGSLDRRQANLAEDLLPIPEPAEVADEQEEVSRRSSRSTKETTPKPLPKVDPLANEPPHSHLRYENVFAAK